MPLTSFSEYDTIDGKKVPVWFALDESRPLAVFAAIWTNGTSVRKVKEGEVDADLYGFLTTEPNDLVGPLHPKAMPVIPRDAEGEGRVDAGRGPKRPPRFNGHDRTGI